MRYALLSALSLTLAITLSPAAAHNGKTVTFARTEVAPDIYMLQGKGGNVAVHKGDDGLLVIDDEWPDMASPLIKALEPLGGVGKLGYIINTHWHHDHAGGNPELGQHAPIIAHDNVRKLLSEPQQVTFFDMEFPALPEHGLPSLTYSETLSLHFNNEHFELVHFPGGHTDGDTVVFIHGSNVVHTGDLFTGTTYPFVDLEHGGNVLRLAQNVGKLLLMVDDETVLLPGHGDASDKQGLMAFHAMLEGTTAEVKAMIAQGLTLEAAQEQGLSEQWSSWSQGFISEAQWIALTYESLQN